MRVEREHVPEGKGTCARGKGTCASGKGTCARGKGDV